MLLEEKLDIKSNNIIDIYSSIPKNNIEKLNLETDTLDNKDKNDLIEKLSDDFIKTKEILQESININMTALRTIRDSLENTPHDARKGEVLARLLESMTDLNQQYLNSSRQYIDIFKSIQNIEENTNKNEENTNKFNIQNIIFSGTLQDIIHSIPQQQNPI